MSIKSFLAVAEVLPVRTSVLLRGNHGIGKSQLVRLLAQRFLELNSDLETYEVIDRRLSQMTEGDMVGLPSTDGNVTRFNPPDWYKQACTQPCVLLLDELNRATPEVMQAAFQIVLDRELNGVKLHPETRVYAAINTGASYNVNEVDPALLDRFWAIDLEPDVQDFLLWARAKNTDKSYGLNCAPVITDFISQNEKWLDPPNNGNPDEVQPSRRSWERLGDALAAAEVLDDPKSSLFFSIGKGFIGNEASIAFTEFCKQIDNQVTGEEILNNWKKASKKVERLGQERMNIALEKVAEYAQKKGKLTAKQTKNLREFATVLLPELRISLWSLLVQHGVDKLDLARAAHTAMADLVLDVFGVAMGEAGLGVAPNIPGSLKTEG